MAKLKAILFDLDGTLRDTRQLIYDALEYTFQAHGKRVPSKEELAPYIHHHSYVREQFMPEVSMEDFDGVYAAHIDQALLEVQLYPGTNELLTELKAAGYKLAVVTAGRRAPRDMRAYGIADYFDAIVGGDDISAHKPDPEGTLLALERLGVQPTEAIMIGDMPTDVRAARAAGLKAFVGITHGLSSRESLEQSGADYIIDSLAELPEVIAAIEKK